MKMICRVLISISLSALVGACTSTYQKTPPPCDGGATTASIESVHPCGPKKPLNVALATQ